MSPPGTASTDPLLERVDGAVEVVDQHPSLAEPEPRQPAAQRLGRQLDRRLTQLFDLGRKAGSLVPKTRIPELRHSSEYASEDHMPGRLLRGRDRPAGELAVGGLDREDRDVGGDCQHAHPVFGVEVVDPVHRRLTASVAPLGCRRSRPVHRAGEAADEIPLGPASRTTPARLRRLSRSRRTAPSGSR